MKRKLKYLLSVLVLALVIPVAMTLTACGGGGGNGTGTGNGGDENGYTNGDNGYDNGDTDTDDDKDDNGDDGKPGDDDDDDDDDNGDDAYAAFVGTWVWVVDDIISLVLNADNTARLYEEGYYDLATWTIDGDTLVVTIDDNGYPHILEFTINGNELSTYVPIDEDGNMELLVFVRQV